MWNVLSLNDRLQLWSVLFKHPLLLGWKHDCSAHFDESYQWVEVLSLMLSSLQRNDLLMMLGPLGTHADFVVSALNHIDLTSLHRGFHWTHNVWDCLLFGRAEVLADKGYLIEVLRETLLGCFLYCSKPKVLVLLFISNLGSKNG